MDVIKRIISFEDATYRGGTGNTVTWGTMTADTFYVKVLLTQNMDDMGMFMDIPFIPESTVATDQPNYTILTQKLQLSGFTFPYMQGTQPPSPLTPEYDGNLRVTGKDLDAYLAYASTITGSTDSKKTDVRAYSQTQNYIAGLDIEKNDYYNYLNVGVSGRTRLTSNAEPSVYVFDTHDDSDLGTPNQTTGILYTDYTGQTRTVNDIDLGSIKINKTDFQFEGEGWNQTNTSLSAQTKEEYLFGITQPPEVFSDVFIDRGAVTVFEKHLRLSEVESLEHLERYNNGFYRIVKE